MKSLPVAVLFFITTNLFGQGFGEIYKVKNGDEISKTLPKEARYQFSDFGDGKVYFRNGRTSLAKLNYSIVHAEVQFISPTRDTMLLTENEFIDRIEIANEVFYFFPGNGHVQQIADNGKVKLCRKLYLAHFGTGRYSAYGQYSETSAISSYSSYMGKDGRYNSLRGNDQISLRKKHVFFFVDKNRRLHQANRVNLLKIYPDHKRSVDKFIEENEIDFNSEEHLLKVVQFAGAL
jgi:hypothetical protein